jgi:hypothetical protein
MMRVTPEKPELLLVYFRNGPRAARRPASLTERIGMRKQHSLREVLPVGAAVARLGVQGFPEWLLPVLAQDETVVPFTDLPPTFTNKRTSLKTILDFRGRSWCRSVTALERKSVARIRHRCTREKVAMMDRHESSDS